jgi:hypothetical protein
LSLAPLPQLLGEERRFFILWRRLPTHLYWSLTCKNEECLAKHPICYLGEHVPGRALISRPASLRFHCLKCGNEYEYLESDILLLVLLTAPPPGFLSLF